MVFRVYSTEYERICQSFYPCNITSADNRFDEAYSQKGLKIYLEDYRTLLLPYLSKAFPLEDPFDNSLQSAFDECFDNWIGKKHWQVILTDIRQKLQNSKNGLTPLEREFYNNYIEWTEDKLERFDVIMVEGNL